MKELQFLNAAFTKITGSILIEICDDIPAETLVGGESAPVCVVLNNQSTPRMVHR